MQFPPSEPTPKIPKLKDILEQLESGDVQLQSVALRAFSTLVDKTQKPLNPNEIDSLVNFLEHELSKEDSSLRTDLFKSAAEIAEKIHPKHIKRILPLMVKELENQNRFRSKIILNMFATIAKSADSSVQPHLHTVIQKTPDLIANPHVRPVIEDFFAKIIQEDMRNIYKDEINQVLAQFPSEMHDFTQPLQDRLYKIEKSLEKLRKKRREDLAKKRISSSNTFHVENEGDLETQKQEIMDTILQKTQKKNSVDVKTSENEDNKKENDEEVDEYDSETEEGKIDSDEDSDSSTPIQGVSFSSLGLKKKKPNSKK